jgi:hypothetical protein
MYQVIPAWLPPTAIGGQGANILTTNRAQCENDYSGGISLKA